MWGALRVSHTRRVLYSVFQKGAWSCLAQDIEVKARRSFFCARRRSLVLGGRGKNGETEGVQELTSDEKLPGQTGRKPSFVGGFPLA